jgi:hypothetical protein
MSDVCATWPPQDAPPAVALHLPLWVFTDPDGSEERVVQGHWNLPAGSWLIPKGDEIGFVQSTDGVVTLVSCGVDLEYQICPDPTWLFLNAGTGLDVDLSFETGVVFKIPADDDFIAIIAANGERASAVVEAKGTDETYSVCTQGECWNYNHSSDPAIRCGIYRCP